jgi:hypothetical protein
MSGEAAAPVTFKYFAVRCVPRPDREEFVNVGVVVFSPTTEYLGAACRLNDARLLALDPHVDVDAVAAALRAIEAVCAGDVAAGPPASLTVRERFGGLSAPKSTVVQPGPVHGGMAADPAAQLQHLLDALVT